MTDQDLIRSIAKALDHHYGVAQSFEEPWQQRKRDKALEDKAEHLIAIFRDALRKGWKP
jgi:hypothetical protein